MLRFAGVDLDAVAADDNRVASGVIGSGAALLQRMGVSADLGPGGTARANFSRCRRWGGAAGGCLVELPSAVLAEPGAVFKALSAVRAGT